VVTSGGEGIPGVETSLLLLYSFGVKSGKLTRRDLVRLLSENPARIFGLWPRKGDISPGFDADIALFDPAPERPLSAGDLHSRAGFSPYEGLPVSGRVMTTILRGQVVYRGGEVIGKPDVGRFQKCEPFDWGRAAG
jgi:dihydropyrimidinase